MKYGKRKKGIYNVSIENERKRQESTGKQLPNRCDVREIHYRYIN